MPRVIIERSGDVRLARGHFKAFSASPDVLVVSDREAEIIVGRGLGRIVERDDKAIPSGRRKRSETPAEPAKPDTPEA